MKKNQGPNSWDNKVISILSPYMSFKPSLSQKAQRVENYKVKVMSLKGFF